MDKGYFTGGDALCGLQHYWPQVKGELRGAWRLYRNWRRIEVPQRAPPLPRSIALALIGLFLKWEEPQMAFLVGLGFHTFLRTGEILSLLYTDVHLHRGAHGAVTVRKSKTGLRFNIDEAVAIYDVELYQLLGSSVIFPSEGLLLNTSGLIVLRNFATCFTKALKSSNWAVKNTNPTPFVGEGLLMPLSPNKLWRQSS